MNNSIKDLQEKVVYISIVLFFLFGSAYLTFYLFKSFFWSIFFAFLLYAMFDRYNKFLFKYINNKDLSSFIVILLILFLVFIPIFFLIYNLIIQFIDLVSIIRSSIENGRIFNYLLKFESIIEYITQEEFFWISYLEKLGLVFKNYPDLFNFLNIQFIAGGVYNFFIFSLNLALKLFIYIFFSLIILYFLFRDGHELFIKLSQIIPIEDELIEKFKNEAKTIIVSIVKGNFFISVLQGFFLGIGFFICSIPNALLYGFLGGIFSLIPIIGTAFVWLPGALYLYFIQNNLPLSIFLAVYSFSAYFILENFIKPLILNKKIGISSALIFFAIIGGLREFGIMGVILGPLLLALFIAIWRIYPYSKEEHTEN